MKRAYRLEIWHIGIERTALGMKSTIIPSDAKTFELNEAQKCSCMKKDYIEPCIKWDSATKFFWYFPYFRYYSARNVCRYTLIWIQIAQAMKTSNVWNESVNFNIQWKRPNGWINWIVIWILISKMKKNFFVIFFRIISLEFEMNLFRRVQLRWQRSTDKINLSCVQIKWTTNDTRFFFSLYI